MTTSHDIVILGTLMFGRSGFTRFETKVIHLCLLGSCVLLEGKRSLSESVCCRLITGPAQYYPKEDARFFLENQAYLVEFCFIRLS